MAHFRSKDVTEMTLPMEAGRFRSLSLGPNGSLYYFRE